MFMCVDRQDRSRFYETTKRFEKEKRNYKIINSPNAHTKFTRTASTRVNKVSIIIIRLFRLSFNVQKRKLTPKQQKESSLKLTIN